MSPIYTFSPRHLIEDWLEDFDLVYKKEDMDELCSSLNDAYQEHIKDEIDKLFHT